MAYHSSRRLQCSNGHPVDLGQGMVVGSCFSPRQVGGRCAETFTCSVILRLLGGFGQDVVELTEESSGPGRS